MSQAGYYTTGFKTVPAKYSLLNYDFETGKHTLQDLSSTSYRALTIDKDAQASTTDTRVTYEARLLQPRLVLLQGRNPSGCFWQSVRSRCIQSYPR